MSNSVELRPVVESDLETFFEQQRDPVANEMAAFPARDHDAFMAHWANIMRNERGTLRTILSDGAIAGNIVSWLQFGEREVGYWIGRDYWGRGVASAALAAFLRVDTARPMHAVAVMHNIGSQRVLLKCGFERGGVERVEENGTTVELVTFTLHG